jgi:hypothetical protein
MERRMGGSSLIYSNNNKFIYSFSKRDLLVLQLLNIDFGL